MSTKNRMRLFVIEPRGSGGMLHYAYQLCNALGQNGTDVTLVTAKNYELEGYPHQFHLNKLMSLWGRSSQLSVSLTRNRLTRYGWKAFRMVRRAMRGIRLFLEWVNLTAYLLKTRPDIVQFGSIEFPFEAIFLRILKSRGLVLTQICHEFEPREQRNSFLVRLNNRLLKSVFETFSVIFFHSPANMKRFCELYADIPSERFQIIPMGNGQIFPAEGNPVLTRQALMDRYNLTSTDQVVLFFGNITPSKGIPDLLDAFKKVFASNSHARLVVAGMPLKYLNVDSLFTMASKLGIDSVTRFDPRYLPIEEVGPLIDLATVVVFPYTSSTQSASIQAAYALGKPVVATRVGGLPDVVEDGKSGFLVEPNSPDQLSAAILKILGDPDLVEKMGRFAGELSETRFAWGPIAGKIASVYQEILSNHKG